MAKNKVGNEEITQPNITEVEQADVREFDKSTAHPNDDNTHVQSEEIRYENADQIYE